VLAWSFPPMILLCATGLFMPNAIAAIVVTSCGSVCIGAITSSAIIALLDITPGTIRGQVVAMYYMMISICGLGLGPTTAGILSTRVFGEENLRWAVSAVPVIYGIVPLLLLPMIARAYRKRLAEIPA
jgi:MFS family permease